MKLIILWSLFIGYCIGGIVALTMAMVPGHLGSILTYLAIFIPGVSLVIYAGYMGKPVKKKRLPRRNVRIVR